ncbi:MAG TPA: hypothetical protein VHW44_03350 [Pseudonocardiaceae bacterium]|nr:hypothetical protein [Pseudonocardiaceae bacterium]
MGFFNEASAADRAGGVVPRPPWVAPPADELPAALPAPIVLVRTSHTVVALVDVLVYRAGFEFTVTGRVRAAEVPDRWPLSMFQVGMPGSGPLSDDMLRFGVQLGDGTKLTNLDPQVGRHDPATEPRHPVMRSLTGAGAGPGRYDFRQWVWPLPPPGPVTFVCQWPSRDIPETRVKLDASVIRTAAESAVPLWSRPRRS